MKMKFKYKEDLPTLEEYNILLRNLKKISKEYFSLDEMINSNYSNDLMIKYESEKRKIINKMFKKIISCFSILNKISCAIYLNGSFARRSITTNSDVDLTFYFNKKDIEKYQPLVLLFRNAIATMLNVSTMHVHSFTKNFTTEYRKENNLVIYDKDLNIEIVWPNNEKYIIDYPSNQMAAERETCEITSIKNIKLLEELYINQMKKYHPKEWVYTHKLIYNNKKSFIVEKLITKLDSMYTKKEIEESLLNIKNEVNDLLEEITAYYNKLEKDEQIDLADFNMIGKRKVTMMFYAFMTYMRWYYIYNDKDDIPRNIDLVSFFNYNSFLVNQDKLINIYNDYNYFRFLISRVEIWTKKYNHHYEHRSKEVVSKDVFYKEYKELWLEPKQPLEEQIKIILNLKQNINIFLKTLE